MKGTAGALDTDFLRTDDLGGTPVFRRPQTEIRPTLGRHSGDTRETLGRHSGDTRETLGRHSGDTRFGDRRPWGDSFCRGSGARLPLGDPVVPPTWPTQTHAYSRGPREFKSEAPAFFCSFMQGGPEPVRSQHPPQQHRRPEKPWRGWVCSFRRCLLSWLPGNTCPFSFQNRAFFSEPGVSTRQQAWGGGGPQI